MNDPVPNADGGDEALAAAVGFVPGVPGLDPGIGGNDSRSDAPKEDEGLKALSPLKPVICGLSGGDVDSEDAVPVAPVGWLPKDENMESGNPELVAVVAVSCALRNGKLDLFSPALFWEKEDATLAMSLLVCAPALNAPNSLSPPSD